MNKKNNKKPVYLLLIGIVLCFVAFSLPVAADGNITPDMPNIFSSGSYYLDKDVVLNSPLIISGEGTRVELDLNGHTLSYYGDSVVKIQNNATVDLMDSSQGKCGAIVGGYAQNGGAVYLMMGTLNFTGGTIKDSYANQRGGAIYLGGSWIGDRSLGSTLYMNGGVIENCSAQYNGGAIYAEYQSNITIDNGTILKCFVQPNNNRYWVSGGGIYCGDGNLTLNDVLIEKCYINSTGGHGGGIYAGWRNFTMNGGVIKDCYVSAGTNGGAYGGGVYASGDLVKLNGGQITNCSVFGGSNAHGGGLYGRAEINGIVINDSRAYGATTANYGGGVYANGDLQLISGQIKDNSVSGTNALGSGIYAEYGTVCMDEDDSVVDSSNNFYIGPNCLVIEYAYGPGNVILTDDAYTIYSELGWNWVAIDMRNAPENATKDIILANDIHVVNQLISLGSNITDAYFEGTFDGQNHMISGIHSWIGSDSWYSYNSIPLIGAAGDNSVIKNLIVSDVDVFSRNSIGTNISVIVGESFGLVKDCELKNVSLTAGYYYPGDNGGLGFVAGNANVIENCSVQNAVLNITESVGNWNNNKCGIGGIAGIASYVSKSTVTNATLSVGENYNWVSLRNTNVGGIAGLADSISSSAFSNSSIVFGPRYSNSNEMYNTSVGGIAGMSNSIENCYIINAEVFASTYAKNNYYNNFIGGITGTGIDVENCYVAGNVTGAMYAGGIAGIASGDIQGNVVLLETLDGAYGVNAVLGNTSVTTPHENFAWAGINSSWYPYGITTSAANGTLVESKTFWKNESTFRNTLGWDFSTIWKMNYGNTNYQLPVLKWQETPVKGDIAYIVTADKTVLVDCTDIPFVYAGNTVSVPISVKDAEDIYGFIVDIETDVDNVLIRMDRDNKAIPYGSYEYSNQVTPTERILWDANGGEPVNGDVVLFYINVTAPEDIRSVVDYTIPLNISYYEFGSSSSGDITYQFKANSSNLPIGKIIKIKDTVEDGTWNAKIPAKFIYNLTPVCIDVLPLPQIEHNGLNTTVTNVSVVATNSTGSYALSALVIDGKVVINSKVPEKSILTVSFNGRKLGDVNNDAKISLPDRIKISQHIVHKYILSGDDLFYADIDKDGSVGLIDRSLIGQYIVKNLDDNYQPKTT